MSCKVFFQSVNAGELMDISLGTSVRACPDSHQVPDGCHARVSLQTGLKVCLHSCITAPTVAQKNTPLRPTQQSDQHLLWYLLSYNSLLREKILNTGNQPSVGVVSGCWLLLCFGTSRARAAASWLIILTGFFFFFF